MGVIQIASDNLLNVFDALLVEFWGGIGGEG
jgi:hypothetical protein